MNFISLLPLSKPARVFAHPHPQKTVRFPAGQSECFHPAKLSFYPPAVTAGITYYTLQAKSCAKWGLCPLWKPPQEKAVSDTPFSHFETVLGLTQSTSASSACVRPRSSRRVRISRPAFAQSIFLHLLQKV